MADFMLVMKGDYKSWNGMSADEKQRIMEKYYSYVNRLKEQNRFKGGSALKHGGVQLRAEQGTTIVDGPYSETKEALNGYFVFEAANQDEAITIAKDCPALTHGERVEVFELSNH
jgi:hypothetical protein